MLPNDTDLTVFRENGKIQGFNFAFIDNHFNYHTAQDSYQKYRSKFVGTTRCLFDAVVALFFEFGFEKSKFKQMIKCILPFRLRL